MLSAASELSVTQSAVSKQIRLLEEWLREPLFDRMHREVRLTPAGAAYFSTVTRLFAELDRATRSAHTRRERVRVRFQGYTTFNMRWLIPRLADFHALHPDVQVDVSAGMGPVDFSRNEVDCAVRTGPAEWSEAEASFVAPIEFRPVARPPRPGDPPLDTIADLRRHVLIVSATRSDMWRRWLALTGSETVEPAGIMTFDHGSYCYQAAVDGVGVALAETIFVKADLETGRLYHPFAQRYRDALAYHFVRPRGRPRPGVGEFGEWLVRQSGVEAGGSGVQEKLASYAT